MVTNQLHWVKNAAACSFTLEKWQRESCGLVGNSQTAVPVQMEIHVKKYIIFKKLYFCIGHLVTSLK
jgi:hypothetical protein